MMRYVPFAKFDKLVRRLRKLVRADVGTSRRDALAMLLGLHGLRVTEIRNLMVCDLDAIDELLLVRTLKLGKPRRLKLGPGVFKALRRLGSKRANTERLFVSGPGNPVCASHWQRFAREVTEGVLGGAGLKFHALRHTFAMRLYVTTRDMQLVKGRLGHRSLNSTQVYVDAYQELDDGDLKRWRKVEVLPGLEVGRGGRVPKADPEKKTRVSLGNRAKKREMPHTKTRSERSDVQKTTSDDEVRLKIADWKSGIEKDLAKQAAANRKSG